MKLLTDLQHRALLLMSVHNYAMVFQYKHARWIFVRTRMTRGGVVTSFARIDGRTAQSLLHQGYVKGDQRSGNRWIISKHGREVLARRKRTTGRR